MVAPCKIPDNTKVGLPVLRVRNIETVLAFYENNLGLQLNREYKDDENHTPIYELGFKRKTSSSYKPFLILKTCSHAKKSLYYIPQGYYHFAILVPDRKSLASTYLALKNSHVHYEGFANHLVSESLYLEES